jgi:hydrogenase maturation protease
MKQVLVAGIGNIFHGDDAFGVEVARQLLARPQPPGVTVQDFGIRAYDLAYALTNGYDAAVLVDAAPRGQAPGTVCLIALDVNEVPEPDPNAVDAHGMNPVAVLRMARALGGVVKNLFLIGCEPTVLECAGGAFVLSEAVQAAVPDAVAMIDLLVTSLLDEAKCRSAGLAPA